MFERLPPMKRFEALLAETAERPSRVNRFVVGATDHPSERRADLVADRGLDVLRAKGSRLPSAPPAAAGSTPRIQRAAMQGSAAGGQVDERTSASIDAALGGGRRFEPQVQERIRRATGHDASTAHVHTDARADQLARSINARAFTVSDNVFFAKGEYRPETDEGMRTLLHESAHLAEGAGDVRRTIRRKISVTPAQLDQSFTHRTGARGVAQKLSSSEISKIREALKKYHSADPSANHAKALARYKKTVDQLATLDNQMLADAQRPLAVAKLQDEMASDPQQMAALQALLKHADEWLRKHPKAHDAADRARIDLIDSIRAEAGVEYAKAQAAATYMGDGRAVRYGAPPVQSGPGANPLNNLKHKDAFNSPKRYDQRNDTSNANDGAGRAVGRRNELVASGELQPLAPGADDALRAGIESLSLAEFAAIHTYTGADYGYMNQNVGGWGRGARDASVEMSIGGKSWKHQGTTDDKTAKQNKDTFEEAGLHAGFIAQAFAKLPLWKGTTYKGMTFDADYLHVTDGSAYKANDYWSTSESRSSSVGFVALSAADAVQKGRKVTKAAMCTIAVSNGRDVSRISNSPGELEILLAPGSIYHIGARRCLVRGKDDAEIASKFGAHVFDRYTDITEFWLIEMKQQFSDDKHGVGAYQRAGTFGAGTKPAGPRKDINPWELMGGRKMLYH